LNRFEENIQAAQITLTSKDLNDINAVLEKIRIVGDCYPEELKKRTGL